MIEKLSSKQLSPWGRVGIVLFCWALCWTFWGCTDQSAAAPAKPQNPVMKDEPETISGPALKLRQQSLPTEALKIARAWAKIDLRRPSDDGCGAAG